MNRCIVGVQLATAEAPADRAIGSAMPTKVPGQRPFRRSASFSHFLCICWRPRQALTESTNYELISKIYPSRLRQHLKSARKKGQRPSAYLSLPNFWSVFRKLFVVCVGPKNGKPQGIWLHSERRLPPKDKFYHMARPCSLQPVPSIRTPRDGAIAHPSQAATQLPQKIRITARPNFRRSQMKHNHDGII